MCGKQAVAAGFWFVSGRLQCTAGATRLLQPRSLHQSNKICCSSCLIWPRGEISTSESWLVSVGVNVSRRTQVQTYFGGSVLHCLLVRGWNRTIVKHTTRKKHNKNQTCVREKLPMRHKQRKILDREVYFLHFIVTSLWFLPSSGESWYGLKIWRKITFIPSTSFIINYNNGVRVHQSVEHHLHLIHLFFAEGAGRVGCDAETEGAFQQKQNRASSSSSSSSSSVLINLLPFGWCGAVR